MSMQPQPLSATRSSSCCVCIPPLVYVTVQSNAVLLSRWIIPVFALHGIDGRARVLALSLAAILLSNCFTCTLLLIVRLCYNAMDRAHAWFHYSSQYYADCLQRLPWTILKEAVRTFVRKSVDIRIESAVVDPILHLVVWNLPYCMII